MGIDLGKRNAAFVRVMMTFIPHIVPVFCTLLYYFIFYVPYIAAIFFGFQFEGYTYQPVGSDMYSFVRR